MSKIARLSHHKMTGAETASLKPPAIINRLGCDRKNVKSVAAQKQFTHGNIIAPHIGKRTLWHPGTAEEDGGLQVGYGGGDKGIVQSGFTQTLTQGGRARNSIPTSSGDNSGTGRKASPMSVKHDGLLRVDGTAGCWNGSIVDDELDVGDSPQVRTVFFLSPSLPGCVTTNTLGRYCGILQ